MSKVSRFAFSLRPASLASEILQVPFALAMTHEHEKTVAHFLDFRSDL